MTGVSKMTAIEECMKILEDARYSDKPWEKVEELKEKQGVEEIEEIIRSKKDIGELSSKELIEYSEIVGAYLVAIGLKTNQIRKFLDSIRRLENNVVRKVAKNGEGSFSKEELLLLKVHLAYAAGRKREVKPFMRVISAAIDKAREEGKDGFEDFKKVVKFIESIVAYHKFYGGKED
ncbi:CRISPR-associated protein Csm2 [Thermoanaerobacter thermohydrosulfuricus]|nr:CRISPR-associated protein Csm2 [Thermoanaerobacter thermohydrosulfuricus]